jgi:uncharacterized membrane protein
MSEAAVDPDSSISTGRSFDRLISLSDAVVAVAITLNILPLIELRPEDGESVWSVLKEDGGQIGSFVFTFLIVGVMWTAHNRILNRMRGYDSSIFWLNLFWLLLIVLLPWPTALYGGTIHFLESPGEGDTSGMAMFYWGTLAVISALGALMGLRCRMRPALLVDPSTSRQTAGQFRGWAFSACFLLIGLVSLISGTISHYLPLGLILLAVLLRESRHKKG